jgi:glutathione S-transferase
MTIKLYDGQRSPNARKVRLIAKELGIDLEIVRPSFAKGELRSPAYLAINPNGKVPALDDDGFMLWESAAILKHLASKRPEKDLVPADPKERVLCDQWLFWWTSHPEAALLRLAMEKLIKPFLGQPGNDAAIIADAEADLARYLPVLEKRLEGCDYVLSKISVVEFAIVPWLEAGVDVAKYPNIRAWMARMQARGYWKDA